MDERVRGVRLDPQRCRDLATAPAGDHRHLERDSLVRAELPKDPNEPQYSGLG